MQLGLSAHLLDIGFDDRWCAQNLGHRVAKSLAYAHATGLGYEGPEIELLAAVLTTYWKWNSLSQIQAKENGTKPKDGPFSRDDICCLTRSEEHTSELKSLMSNSYAVFCVKKKTNTRMSHIQSTIE